MKKENIFIWMVVIALLVSIAAMVLFERHPIFTMGKYEVRWDGVRHMSFTSVDGANMINGHVENIKVHRFGPITVFPRHD